jgi:probable HAF family extracellular repeat protein
MLRECAMVLAVMSVIFSGAALALAGAVTDLGTLPGDANSAANGINNAGQIVGTSWVGAPGYSANNAWVYDGAMHAVTTSGAAYGNAIDSTGTKVVGSTEDTGYPANPPSMGYVGLKTGSTWSTTLLAQPSMKDTDGITPIAFGQAFAIYGNIAGGGTTNADPVHGTMALLWDVTNPTSYTDLRNCPGGLQTLSAGNGTESVKGINAHVAMGQFMISFYSKGFVFDLDHQVSTLVPSLGGNNCYPNAVNANNVIVGAASESSSMGLAIRAMKAQYTWNGTNGVISGEIDLGGFDPAPGTYSQSRALAVNKGSQIVGWSYDGGGISGTQRAFYWDAANGMKDLNTVFASVMPAGGWVLHQATGINDSGWIVANATDSSGTQHGFLLKLMAGDANLDGSVNITDLSKVLTNYDKSGLSWGDGDFSGDGSVNISDLSTVLTNYDTHLTAGAGIHAVPEPCTLVLLCAGLAGLLAFAWRKRS